MNNKCLKYYLYTSIAAHVIIFSLLFFVGHQEIKKLTATCSNANEYVEFIEIDLQDDPEDLTYTNAQINDFFEKNDEILYQNQMFSELSNEKKLQNSIQQEKGYITHAPQKQKIDKVSSHEMRRANLLQKKQLNSNINLEIHSIKDAKLTEIVQNKLISCWNAPMTLSDFDNIVLNFNIKLNKKGKITDIILRNKVQKKIAQTMHNNFNRAIMKCMPSEELQVFDYKKWRTIDLTVQTKLKSL